MSSEVPIEIEDKQTAVSVMRELVEKLQGTALKREIARNPKSDEYRKALKGTEARLTIAKQILAREEATHEGPTQSPCRPRCYGPFPVGFNAIYGRLSAHPRSCR
jgi:hypothetical protein